jgi:cysteine desulfurase
MMIYLDNNATTPVAQEVLEAMLPYLTERWGNPSSLYPFGNQLGQALIAARTQVATLINAARAAEVIFTSGGTESNHLAIRGALRAHPQKKHIVTSVVEHSSILGLCKLLETDGYTVTYLPVDGSGQISLEDLESAIRDDTSLVSFMWANNETGILSPMAKIGEVCARKGVTLHSDAVQAVGKIPIDLEKVPVQLLSIAAHKIHGPKGVGALYIRRGTKWTSPVPGAQENGRRAGTENVAGGVGLGVAAELAQRYLMTGTARVESLRSTMETRLLQAIPDGSINGQNTPRLGNTCNINIRGIDGETAIMMLAEHGICASTGSACSAGRVAASHVIQAMGVDMQTHSPIRLSLARTTTPEDVERTCTVLPSVVERLRRLNPKNM